MKIVITEVHGERVAFTCGLGDGVGWWSSGAAPSVGGTYYVELSIDEMLRWDETILGVLPQTPSALARAGDGVVLIATIEEVEGLGEGDVAARQLLLGLRVDAGTTVRIMTTQDFAATPSVGTRIRAHIRRLALYDIRL